MTTSSPVSSDECAVATQQRSMSSRAACAIASGVGRGGWWWTRGGTRYWPRISARRRQLVVAQLGALSPRQREVFELIELRGFEAMDVATRLGIEPSTVRVLLLRARRAVRARMLARHPDLLEDYRS